VRRAAGCLLLGLALACRREQPQPLAAPVPAAAAAPVIAAPEVKLTDVSGQVTRTRASQQVVALDEPLAPSDVVVTGADGAAVLRLPDGRALSLQPNSRVRIKTARAGELVVEIEHGQLLSRVPAQLGDGVPAITLDILTPLGVVHVPRSEHESAITVRPEKVTVAVAVGEIDFVDRTGQPSHAGASQQLEVSLGGIELLSSKAAEPAPRSDPRTLAPGEVVDLSGRLRATARRGTEVALPPARGLRVYADALAQVSLTWPEDLADAVIEVASDAKFEKLALMARPTGTSLRLPAPRRGQQLNWRISGTTGGARRTLLGHARFLPDRARSLLDLSHPRNLVADTGQVTTVYFQSVLPALTFSFAARPGAASYRVQVFRAGDLAHPIQEDEVQQTTCALAAGALGEGSYLWHAVALDGRGQEVSGGLMNKLEIVYDNPLNTLAIGSPKPGEAVAGPQVDVTGAAPVGSRLFVNGHPVPLDPKGRFEVRVERSPSLVFRLVAGDGSESYWVRQLRTRS
jgi:hypothetical protein